MANEKKSLIEKVVLLVTVVAPVWGLVYQAGQDSQTLTAVAEQTVELRNDVNTIKENLQEYRLDVVRLEGRVINLEEDRNVLRTSSIPK